MSRVLHLTNDQFDALYELLDETITDISSDLDPELVASSLANCVTISVTSNVNC